MESQLNCSAHRFPPPALVKFHKEILVWFSTVNAPQKNLSDRSGEIHGLLPRLLSPKKVVERLLHLSRMKCFNLLLWVSKPNLAFPACADSSQCGIGQQFLTANPNSICQHKSWELLGLRISKKYITCMFHCRLAYVWSCSDDHFYAIQACLSLSSGKHFPASCKVESYNWTQTKSKSDSSPAAIFALGTHSMRITCTECVANSSRTVAAAGNSWQSGCHSQRIWNASTPSGWSTPLVLMQMTNTWERLPFNQLFFQSVPTYWIQVLFLRSHPNK